MTANRWKEIEAVFERALEVPAEKRAAFLKQNCNGDEELCREVESLLQSHASAGSFIDERNLFISDEAVAAEEDAVPVGQLIGAYRIVREIGRGGMGAVYLAERADEQYKKQVAIKLIKRGMDTDLVLRHFRRERQIMADLDHPNIGRLFDGGTTKDGLPYFVMEYIEGAPINQYCNAQALSVQERLKLFLQVCAAVSYAHEHTVIHRDIKPSNIFVTSKGVPKLLDFGIAKILQSGDDGESLISVTGTRPMTPEYASPEQVRGEQITKASDIYSLGVVLYELLTGSFPYRLTIRSSREIERAITEQEPTRPSTVVRDSKLEHRESTTSGRVQTNSTLTKLAGPTGTDSRALRGDLDNIVLMALRKEPARRYQSVDDFAEDIRRHLEARPVLARKDTITYRATKFVRRNRASVGATSVCLLLLLAVAWLAHEHVIAPERPAPEKSVAILPFENLTKDPKNAFLTEGVQDEILTGLSHVADLKVISRTSSSQYKNTENRNLREIGQQLGVANLVEGSVQRAENRVRVNAQLINARTDAHLWAQTYDGDITDVFAIQSQIARTIADQLQARLSGSETAAIARLPTKDIAAYELYRRALPLEFRPPFRENLLEGIRLLEQAVARDPKFLAAYCALSRLNMVTYFGGIDHTPARRELANVAIEKAAQIQPDAAEVHLEKARYWFHGFFDYDRARTELELARRGLPNNSQVYYLAAAMDRRQGRWSEAVQSFERAVELDPRDGDSLMNTAFTLEGLRRYSEATEYYRRAAALDPRDYFARIAARGYQAMNERADLRPLRAELDAILAEDPKSLPQIAEHLWPCAIRERNRHAVEQALAAIPPEGIYVGGNFVRPREDFVAYAARMFGDDATATRAYTAARAIFQKQVEEQPEYATAWSYLGVADAALGRKEEASREGRRACELLPLSKDAWHGPGLLRSLAKIYAGTGEKDLALATLEQLLTNQMSGIYYGDLKLDPDWDPVRGDPRFEQLVARLAPATTVPEKSIAVLPFQNLSGDPENAYFADGMQEEILTRLSKIADLKVISRTSTQRYKNSSEPLSAIAQQLGVAHVLEGTVQKAADQVRVNVQLINAEADSQLWAEKFDRKLADIFTTESDIATKIAETLQAKLTGAERRAISVHPTKNTEAHDLYLKGRHQWRNFYAPGYERVRDYYEKAIALDPSYAPAHVGLSLYHSWAAANGIFSPDHWPLAEAAVRKALSLDENLPEAYNALAAVEVYYKHDWPAAERAFRRGMELDPNFGDIHTHYGLCLSYFGRFKEAIEQTDRGLELDPFFPGSNIHRGTILFFSRDYERAAAQLTKTLEMFPDNPAAHDWLGEVSAKKGMAQEAITHWCTALRLRGQPQDAQLTEDTFKNSGFDVAVRMLGEKQLQDLDRKRSKGEYVAPANYVFANVRRGNFDEAFKWLPAMVREPDWFALQIRVNPVLDPLRSDPRFEKLVTGGGQ